jgi:hypothetical protein
MGRFRVMAVACACVLLAACGGTTAKQASIERLTANRLANVSDEVAATLQRGDSCAAASKARTLRSQVASAIDSGAIPHSLAASARSASARLVNGAACTPPPPPTPPAAQTCAAIDAQKEALEQEKDSLGKGKKGKAAGARRKQIDQEEHELDQERKGCG